MGVSSAWAAPIQYAEADLPELANLLEKARENAPALVAQGLGKEESVARLDAAKALYYPRMDVYSTIGGRQTEYSDSRYPAETSAGANFSAYIRRPLYHWGAIEAKITQARLDQKNEDLQQVMILRQIKRGMRANYFTLLLNQVSLDNLKISRELAQKQITGLKSDKAAGTVSNLDAEKLSLNQEQTLIDIDYLTADQRRIYEGYKRDLGWTAPLKLDQAIPRPDVEAVLAWVEKTRATGLSGWVNDHAEVMRRKNLIEREKAELTSIKSRLRPLVNLALSASQDQRNTGGSANMNALTYFAGLEVNWNIFDGFANSAQIREANLRKRRYETLLAAYRAELTAQAYDVLNKIAIQARQLQLNEKRSQSTAESLKVAKLDAGEGRLSVQTLQERQLGFQKLQLEVLSTRVTLLLAINDYLDLTIPAAVSL